MLLHKATCYSVFVGKFKLQKESKIRTSSSAVGNEVTVLENPKQLENINTAVTDMSSESRAGT